MDWQVRRGVVVVVVVGMVGCGCGCGCWERGMGLFVCSFGVAARLIDRSIAAGWD